MATPLRDELGLNEGGMSLAVSSQRALREQQVRASWGEGQEQTAGSVVQVSVGFYRQCQFM
jgi:hypothetical protein